ncbi:hypothetical protein [Blastococcus brunescens]|uniref:Uncharacterized protein n=1 Tax=Blastococcus brunescens TaxID=1564165 RepID=A0ABZ1B5W6_9ACTN|nr:hypothetical protein [Blastococcus sp. BMG 8361]WRL66134.1 hypothetical protein U6N30_11850 [Blastococcus sp. BMG 8361]
MLHHEDGGRGARPATSSAAPVADRAASWARGMPSSASRSRTTTRRSPRQAPRATGAPPAERPLAAIVAAIGGTREVWSTLLLLVGPGVCLVFALRRPVRDWTTARRPPGGRRDGARER